MKVSNTVTYRWRPRRLRGAGIIWLAATAVACGSGRSAEPTAGVTPDGVSYESRGTGNAVVLIHGFSLDRRMWGPQLEVLVERYQVVQYDLRGHGRSGAPRGPFAAYDDVAAVLDALSIDRASLIGLSAGAQVAIDFALIYPDRVNKLVVASPGLSGYVPREPFTWFQPVAEALEAGDLEVAASLWAETPLMTVSDSVVASTVKSIVMDNSRIWSYRREDRPPDPPAVARMAELTMPVLVVVGERDLPNIHGVVDTLMTCVVTARKLTIPGAHHMVNMSHAAVFNRTVVSFLEERSFGRASLAASPCAS